MSNETKEPEIKEDEPLCSEETWLKTLEYYLLTERLAHRGLLGTSI